MNAVPSSETFPLKSNGRSANDLEHVSTHSDHPAAASAELLAPPPSAPRPVTPHVGRRAWMEPRVRFWWLAAAVVLAISLYFLTSRWLAWRSEVRLLSQGVEVKAIIRQTATEILKGKTQPPNSICTLDYTYEGKNYEVVGVLKGREQYVVTGQEVPIRIDPKNPEDWTGLTAAPPLWTDLVEGLIVLPVALLLAAAGLAAKGRLTRLWRDGKAREAIVIDVKQTAMAPRSRLVRCTPADDTDSRIISVYVPHRGVNLQEGDALWLITPPGKVSRAIAAAWFA